jgi:hypothetical protein
LTDASIIRAGIAPNRSKPAAGASDGACLSGKALIAPLVANVGEYFEIKQSVARREILASAHQSGHRDVNKVKALAPSPRGSSISVENKETGHVEADYGPETERPRLAGPPRLEPATAGVTGRRAICLGLAIRG